MTDQEINQVPEGRQTIEKAAEHFVQSNMIPAKEGEMCVDGRYAINSEDSGRAAIPGGTLGDVMALMGVSKRYNLGLSPAECFDKVYQIATTNNGKFYLHTDDHADPDEPDHKDSQALIGCGHGNKAADPRLAEMFGVDAKEMAQLIKLVKEKVAEGDLKMVMTKLHGSHAEQGVLRVLGTEHTVNHSDQQTQYFVYDADRHEEHLRILVDHLDMAEVTFERIKQAADIQTGATLKLLAAGKPLIDVDTKADQPEVHFVDTIAV